MFKQLFAEPPPNAVDHLLTPRRKLIYGVIAFAPGTLLALYLSSVKKRMNEENDALRRKHVSEELADEVAREQKDLVLMQMIEELRDRLQQLERQARNDTVHAKAEDAAKPTARIETGAPSKKQETIAPERSVLDDASTVTEDEATVSAPPTELPGFLAEYEDALRPWLDRFDSLRGQFEKLKDQVAPLLESKNKEDAASPPAVPTPSVRSSPTHGGVGASGIRDRVAEREREMLAQDIRAFKQASREHKPQ